MKLALKIVVLIGGLTFVWFALKTSPADIFGSIVYHGEAAKEPTTPAVSMTFDDGPYGEPTSKILDILKEKNVKATFFVIGKNAEKYPELVKREIAEGHLIGNHSYNHSLYLAAESGQEFKINVEDAEKSIISIIGARPRFFRPPFGLTSSAVLKVLHDSGYQVILWNNMTDDWKSETSAELIVNRILKRLQPGAIIVLHDGRDIQTDYPRDNVTKALPEIIDKIRGLGYEFVPLDKLINQHPYF